MKKIFSLFIYIFLSGCMMLDNGPKSSSYQVSITPDNYSNLVLWLNSDSLTNANGAPVTSWKDSNGSNLTAQQGSSAIAPLMSTNALNGHSTVQFTGSKSLSIPGFSPALGSSARTFILVIQNSVHTGLYWNETILGYGDSISFGQYVIASSLCSGSSFGIDLYNSCQDSNFALTTSATILVARYDGVNNELYSNGVLLSKKPAVLTTQSTYSLTIGKSHVFNVYYGKFDLAELIIYDRALDNVELNNIEYYLSDKYKITLN